MGGNALKNCITHRLSANDFFAIQSEVLDILRANFDNQFENIPAYRSKPDYGDLDIIYATSTPLKEDDIRQVFRNTKQVVVNTNVLSFEHRQFQIDLIGVPHDSFHYARNYFSWNDCGNLVGRISKRLSIKHGHDGLFLQIDENKERVGSILLTRNYPDALNFLDLNYEQYLGGFDTLEQIFVWVYNSKWFDPSRYWIENLSHSQRVRDIKRPTYQAFLKWVSEQPAKEVISIDTTNYQHLSIVFEHFPHARCEYERLIGDYACKLISRQKFNGDIVSEITALQHKQLGDLMAHLRNNTILGHRYTVCHMTKKEIQAVIESAKNVVST